MFRIMKLSSILIHILMHTSMELSKNSNKNRDQLDEKKVGVSQVPQNSIASQTQEMQTMG